MGGPLAWPRPLPPPLPGEVRGQLARILDSPELAVPELMRGFLRYLVEQTLARCAEQLKGYTIGTAVFERDVSFDSQADPVVRTEAGRLRRALERYYLVAGQCRKAARSHILPREGDEGVTLRRRCDRRDPDQALPVQGPGGAGREVGAEPPGDRRSAVDRPRDGHPLPSDGQPAPFGTRDTRERPPCGRPHRHGPERRSSADPRPRRSTDPGDREPRFGCSRATRPRRGVRCRQS